MLSDMKKFVIQKFALAFLPKKFMGLLLQKRFLWHTTKKVLIAFSTNEFHWLHSQRFKQEFLTNGRVCYMGEGDWGSIFCILKLAQKAHIQFFARWGTWGIVDLKRTVRRLYRDY